MRRRKGRILRWSVLAGALVVLGGGTALADYIDSHGNLVTWAGGDRIVVTNADGEVVYSGEGVRREDGRLVQPGLDLWAQPAYPEFAFGGGSLGTGWGSGTGSGGGGSGSGSGGGSPGGGRVPVVPAHPPRPSITDVDRLGPGRSGASPLPHDGRLPEVGPSGLELRPPAVGGGEGGGGGASGPAPLGVPWLGLAVMGGMAGALLGRRLALGGRVAGAPGLSGSALGVTSGGGSAVAGAVYGGEATVAGAVYGAGGGHGAAAYGRAEIAGGVERPGLPAAAEVTIGPYRPRPAPLVAGGAIRPAPTFLERLGSGLWNVITGTGLEEWGKWGALTGGQRAWLVARGAVNVALWALTPLRLLAVGKQGAVLLGRALGRALPGAVDLLGPVAGKLGAWKAGFQNYLYRQAARVTEFLSRFPVARVFLDLGQRWLNDVQEALREQVAKKGVRAINDLLKPGLGHIAVQTGLRMAYREGNRWLKEQAAQGKVWAYMARGAIAGLRDAWGRKLKAWRGAMEVVGGAREAITGGQPLKLLGPAKKVLEGIKKRLGSGGGALRGVGRALANGALWTVGRTLDKKAFDEIVSTVRKGAAAVGRGIGAAGRGLVAAARSAVGATRAAARRVSGTVQTVARAARAAAGSVSRAVRSAVRTVAGVAGRAWRTGAGTMSRSVRTVSRGASRVWSSGTRAARRWFTRPAYRPSYSRGRSR